MKEFGTFYLDKEKDVIVTLFREKDGMRYKLETPNHGTGNLITNLARLCGLELGRDENGLKVIRGSVPCYIDAYNRKIYIFRLGGTKTANIYEDGRIEMKASLPAISKTLMSQTKDFRFDVSKTIVKTYILSDCKFRTDLHTHMNGNLHPDILIALGIRHQIRYPLYYIRKLGLRCSPAQAEMLSRRRKEAAARFADSPLSGRYLERRIDDNTFINFADLILNDPEDAAYNIARIRTSLTVLKDGQAVFTNLEKVYLYRYVFTKAQISEDLIDITLPQRIPDPDIRAAFEQMLKDRKSEEYRDNTLFQDKLLWIARGYQRCGICYAEISDTTLVKKEASVRMLEEVHSVMPKVTAETGVTLRFLAAIRRIPLTIIRDNVAAGNYLAENLAVLKTVAADPYVAGSDIVGEEINDIRELQPLIREITAVADEVPGYVIRIHAGENDSLVDNVANSIRCVVSSLRPGQKMPRMRIGHGLYTANLNSAKGKALLAEIRNHNVILEFQITSNVRLNNLNTLDRHPLKQYMKAGIKCVQGTDGGALYGTDSIDEQLTLEKMLELTPDEMRAMRRTEEEVILSSMKVFGERMAALAGNDSYFEEMRRLQETPGDTSGQIMMIRGSKYETSALVKDLVRELPADRIPVVIAGGSFNNDRHRTSVTPQQCALIDRLIETGDPGKMFFVTGGKLSGYERYLVSRCRGRYDVFAFLPAMIGRSEASRIRKAGVSVRIAIEAAHLGVYKSISYEIFKRRPSVLVALDGNSAGENLVQEAKNGRGKARIFIASSSRGLREKARSLEGYITLFDDVRAADAVIASISELYEKGRTGK